MIIGVIIIGFVILVSLYGGSQTVTIDTVQVPPPVYGSTGIKPEWQTQTSGTIYTANGQNINSPLTVPDVSGMEITPISTAQQALLNSPETQAAIASILANQNSVAPQTVFNPGDIPPPPTARQEEIAAAAANAAAIASTSNIAAAASPTRQAQIAAAGISSLVTSSLR